MISRKFIWFWLLAAASTFLHVSGFVFYPLGNGPLRWNVTSGAPHPNVVNPATRAIRYYIASDAYSAANREAEIAAVKACFDQWQSVPGANIRFEFAGLVSPQGLDIRKDNTNVVFWRKNSLQVNGGQMNISGLRAWTFLNATEEGGILEADIVLNGSQYQWFTDFNNTTNQAQFIESTLLHEIGHFLGLDHAVVGGATVITGSSGISTEAGLSADEIAAARFLYPEAQIISGRISGTVRLNGNPILGATVVAEDSAGNIANATVTQADGSYLLAGLAGGDYRVRVTPLDPANAGIERLIRGIDVAAEYADAVTGFSATANRSVTVRASESTSSNFDVSPGPAFRITSISTPTTIANLPSVSRHAVTLRQGQRDYYVGVSGFNLPNGAQLTITGDGLEIGPSTFLEGRLVPGMNTYLTKVNVSQTATPGLRSFVLTHNGNVAYANGFLEIAPLLPDYNFDLLDDRFQRQFWIPWTSADASPSSDPDGDRFSNAFEHRTGTIPTDPASNRLLIRNVSRTGSVTSVTWDSDPGKRYQLYGRASLATGSWTPIGRSLSAGAFEMTQVHNVSSAYQFYRVELLP